MLEKLTDAEREQIRADYRLKAEMDERWRMKDAYNRGYLQGRIEVLQEFLGETPTPEKFEDLSRIELSAIFDELQAASKIAKSSSKQKI